MDEMSKYEIPIFPLNTVLFPGAPLHLHIFEERYKIMINRVLAGNSIFGVVLIKTGTEALGPVAQPHRIGCIARITHVEPLSDGRMNLTAIGENRFQILSLSHDRPYLYGFVDNFPLGPFVSHTDKINFTNFRSTLQSYLQMMNEIDSSSESDLDRLDLSKLAIHEDPTSLLFLACAILQVPAAEKQPILEIYGANEILTYLLRVLKREISVYRALLKIGEEEARRSARLN
jgi:uncharacterized protein